MIVLSNNFKLQRSTNEDVHLGQIVDPSENTGKIKATDIATNFDTINEKIVKLNKLLNYGIMNRL